MRSSFPGKDLGLLAVGGCSVSGCVAATPPRLHHIADWHCHLTVTRTVDKEALNIPMAVGRYFTSFGGMYTNSDKPANLQSTLRATRCQNHT